MLTESVKNLYLIKETSFGVTPTSPSFTAVRKTTESIDYKRDEIESAEKSADRRAPYTYPGSASVDGDITTELVYGSGLDDLFAAGLCGTWAAKATKTAITISSAASDNSLNDSGSGFVTAGFESGDKISVSGAITVASATITSVAAGKIIVSGVTLTDISDGTSVTITDLTQRLKAGVTRSSYSMLRDITTLTTGRYHLFTGLQVNTTKLSYAPKAHATATFSMVGLNMADPADAVPSGATLGALTTTNPQNTILAEILVDGVVVGNATAFDISLENGIETTPVIGSEIPYHTTDASSTKIGDRKPSGTITMIFDDDQAARITGFKAGTTYAVSIKTANAEGYAYKFYMPKIKYTAVPTAVGDDGTSAMTYKAMYDATAATELYIDKIPA